MFNVIFVQNISQMKERILIIGSSGQIGTELVMELRKMYGNNNVIASDIRPSSDEVMQSGPFETLDILDEQLLRTIVKKYKVTQVYLLAALLSATAEKTYRIRLGIKYAFAFSCIGFGKRWAHKKDFLAIFNCGFWTNNSKRKYSTIYSNGTQYCLWNYQTSRGKMERILF